MGLAPRFETPDALWFGIGVHLALADWYQKGTKRGPSPADTFEEWVEGEFRAIRATGTWDQEPKYEDAAELGVAMLKGYVDRYGTDQDWDVIAIEQPFKVKIANDGKPVAYFQSTWDGVYRDRGNGNKVFLMEHKTASQISTSYLELDDQGGSYWAVAAPVLRKRGVLRPGEEIEGITYNFLRKTKPDTRPQNARGEYLNLNGEVSKKQPPPAFVREVVYRDARENAQQMKRIADEVAVMNAMRDGVIPVTKSTTKDCTFCTFFNMCTLHERGGDSWLEVADADFIRQNPYERYQKSAGGAW
jgi:hypothetical protein